MDALAIIPVVCISILQPLRARIIFTALNIQLVFQRGFDRVLVPEEIVLVKSIMLDKLVWKVVVLFVVRPDVDAVVLLGVAHLRSSQIAIVHRVVYHRNFAASVDDAVVRHHGIMLSILTLHGSNCQGMLSMHLLVFLCLLLDHGFHLSVQRLHGGLELLHSFGLVALPHMLVNDSPYIINYF